jgi:hypothetical protein
LKFDGKDFLKPAPFSVYSVDVTDN